MPQTPFTRHNRLFNQFDNRLNVLFTQCSRLFNRGSQTAQSIEQPVGQPTECLYTRYTKLRHDFQTRLRSELITHYLPPRALRSSNTNLLARPTGITTNFISRAFSVSAPSTWKSLPTHIRSLDKLSAFKRQLKSHLDSSPLLPPSHPVPLPQIRSTILALYKLVYSRLFNRLNNRLHRVNKHSTGCPTGCSAGLTTGFTTV